jgi:hypothetical protein
MTRSVLILLLLAGCSSEPCPDDLPPRVAACIAPAGGWTESPTSVEEVAVSFAGDVMEAGVGTPPEAHCFQEMHPGAQNPPSELDVVWAKVRNGTEEWFVGLSTPGIGDGVLPGVGQELSVDYRYRFGGFGPDVGHLTLWDGAGEAIAWVGEAADVDGLSTPDGVTVSRGSELCTDTDTCGAWVRYTLSVGVGDQSQRPVDYGQDLEIEGFQVVHAGYDVETSFSQDCTDWFVADVQLAVVRN